MKNVLLACVAIAGLASAGFAPAAFAAGGPDATQIERMQQRHALLLDAHLAAMKAGLNSAKRKPATGRPSKRRSATRRNRGRSAGVRRATAWRRAKRLRRSSG